ncbi:hypothetical protein GGTG_01351 [Gaeumannomyces tritici R3-111a-1]|uniref:Uncharacterized protein n=1 Tax=Gaeumannomyces tritici (strain R3-111a-1) TaxID=644352 RepID=J3NJB9_GAET3|nr:hypothetical protein GGTG_01351 [Gaeumannomyces tritici R3-111a-1]EJT81370.1 hypothetical protein GGTG_01351 [Gaeumannomyces tritici R3-111a-1]
MVVDVDYGRLWITKQRYYGCGATCPGAKYLSPQAGNRGRRSRDGGGEVSKREEYTYKERGWRAPLSRIVVLGLFDPFDNKSRQVGAPGASLMA